MVNIKILISILNWNAAKDTIACVDSLLKINTLENLKEFERNQITNQKMNLLLDFDKDVNCFTNLVRFDSQKKFPLN